MRKILVCLICLPLLALAQGGTDFRTKGTVTIGAAVICFSWPAVLEFADAMSYKGVRAAIGVYQTRKTAGDCEQRRAVTVTFDDTKPVYRADGAFGIVEVYSGKLAGGQKVFIPGSPFEPPPPPPTPAPVCEPLKGGACG